MGTGDGAVGIRTCLPMSIRLIPVALCMLASLWQGGCSTQVQEPYREAPRVLPTARELQARIETERGRLRSLRTLADSEITGPDGTFKTSEVLLIEPPDHLRIEVLTPFGVTWILATDGRVLDVYSRQEETVYRGRPTPDLIDHYLPVPLALADLTELLLGRPPRRAVARPEGVGWEAETGGFSSNCNSTVSPGCHPLPVMMTISPGFRVGTSSFST